MKSQRKPDEGSKSKTSNNTSGFSQKQGHQQPDSLHSLSEPPVQHFQTRQYALLHDSKNMELFQDAIQLVFPGYGYPAYPCPTIPAVSNIQAEGHQTNPKAACYQTSVDPLKQSSSTEKPQDMPSRALMMTPQEKIEKLRLRQQQHALRAIQQQQQQFRQEGSGRDTLVPRAYSRRKKNSDSLGSSGIIDENAPEQTSACRKEIHKNSGIPDDPFIEEKIYYELKDALGKLDARTRLCIRDSLLRLAHSSSQRQIAGDRTSSNKTKRDEDEVSENDASNRRKRKPVFLSSRHINGAAHVRISGDSVVCSPDEAVAHAGTVGAFERAPLKTLVPWSSDYPTPSAMAFRNSTSERAHAMMT
ncbi:unnamed protein product [Triticum turgidum subsp. durum]|uniref:Uncharacterized protein n=1 Tax=Triticum turgidum subsp. durum TaxID=4567 RepID=A0A9R0RIK7_TRITD|nr:unnamed protein product [Triticum turgidum subsp. durum]